MSGMDHGYARTKLEQLLRDLDHYNQFEFWRQMSRIAKGASGMPHAEELMAQREDANEAKQISETRAEVAEGRIAELSAHIEEAKRLVKIAQSSLAADPDMCFDDDEAELWMRYERFLLVDTCAPAETSQAE